MMKQGHTFCLSISLLLLFICCIQGEYLEQKKVIYLDRTPVSTGINNFLFRGNEPKLLVNGTDVVAYDTLRSYLASAALNQGGFQLPTTYYLIDIKFVYDPNDPAEKGDVILEQDYFKANPTEGEYFTHIILGDLQDPTFLDNKTVVEKAKNLSSWQHDDLPTFIPSIRDLLYTKRDQATVIYFHCECGCDRTGEVGGAYAMKYLDRDYKAATSWNEIIAGRPILPNHQFAIHWYCLYLLLVENAEITC